GAARDVGLVERMDALQPGDLLHANNALVACLVREPRRTHHVADGVKSGRSGAAPFVDDDVALLDADALLLEPDPLDIAGDADGENDAVGRNLFDNAAGLAPARGHAVGSSGQSLDMCFGVNDDSLPRERLAREV